nr:hypothetical protein [Pseudonocardia sp. MH-G8]
MVVEGADRDPGPGGDVVHGHVVGRARAEELFGGVLLGGGYLVLAGWWIAATPPVV